MVVNAAMKAERQQYLGVSPYERSEQRRDQANGFKPKTVRTRMGEIKFAVPQVRTGEYYPQALEKGLRSERALTMAMAERYVQGTSTRKVNAIVEKLCGSRGAPCKHGADFPVMVRRFPSPTSKSIMMTQEVQNHKHLESPSLDSRGEMVYHQRGPAGGACGQHGRLQRGLPAPAPGVRPFASGRSALPPNRATSRAFEASA